MRLQLIAGALALAGSSAAFSDSSPLVLLSTAKFPSAPNTNQIQTAAQALQHTKDILSKCPTDRYLLVSQAGLNAGDLEGSAGCAMPTLCRAVEDSLVQGKFIVSEVVGGASKDGLAKYIENACAQEDRVVEVVDINLVPLASDRAKSLEDNDMVLRQKLDKIVPGDSYTLLFIGTPSKVVSKDKHDDSVRVDLRRQSQGRLMRRETNETELDTRPLFEKYQFFTPGVFMAIITAIVLLSILGVGMSALSSLEVSYGAFDKEMGPAAQKKQQ